MGDLDISGEDKEDEESEFASSFEISSNSSNKVSSSSLAKSNSVSARNANKKKFKEDRESQEGKEGYLRDDQFQGFISKQSPFSFKNPIFFSCPNNKQGVPRNVINTQDL